MLVISDPQLTRLQDLERTLKCIESGYHLRPPKCASLTDILYMKTQETPVSENSIHFWMSVYLFLECL